ncbi:MAG: 1-deoxy-D-xylulose-5-phosphate synthase N-terminal domain-containing protein, partial [Thermoplasmata archaeon]
MGDEVPHELVESLEATAREFRRDVIRAAVATGQRPPAGSLSVADLLSVLVAHEIRADPDHPDGPDRDRLVLSRSDAAAALRPALIHQGFVARDALRPPEGRAPPSPDPRDGFELGLGTAVGLALDARLDRRGTRVYAVAGDGECQNGGTWEALLAAGHYRLENLVVVFDRNEFEADGATETLLGIEPLV